MSKILIGLFEDTDYKLLNPLSLLRPTYEIKNGILSNRERVEKVFSGYNYCLFTRDYLANLLKWKLNTVMNREDIYVNKLVEKHDILLINGRVLLNKTFVEDLQNLLEVDGNVVALSNSNIVALKLTSDIATKFKPVLMKPFHTELLSDLEDKADIIEMDIELVKNPKDFLVTIDSQLEFDIEITSIKRTAVHTHSEISRDVTFNETRGVVIVSRSSRLSNSVINGPAFIGDGTVITGSEITRAVIGNNCKIMNSVIKDSIVMDNVIIYEGVYMSKTIIGSWSKVMPSACLYGELIRRYEWSREGEYIIIGDYCTVGPGTIIYPGVTIGILSSVHRVCETKIGPFELRIGSIQKKLSLEEIVKSVQFRHREVNKFISDYELNVIKGVYEELS